MFRRDGITSSNFINYSTLNGDHNWEHTTMYVFKEINKLALPKTITSNIRRDRIFNPIFVVVCEIF